MATSILAVIDVFAKIISFFIVLRFFFFVKKPNSFPTVFFRYVAGFPVPSFATTVSHLAEVSVPRHVSLNIRKIDTKVTWGVPGRPFSPVANSHKSMSQVVMDKNQFKGRRICIDTFPDALMKERRETRIFFC